MQLRWTWYAISAPKPATGQPCSTITQRPVLRTEVAYQVQRSCMDYLDAPVERVTSDDVPMPYAKNLEDEVQPQVRDVVAAVRRALYLEE